MLVTSSSLYVVPESSGVFISNDIDDILIVQYTEEAQYIGELHANGLLENAPGL